MKSKYTFLFCFFFITSLIKAQTSQNYAVMLKAIVATSPASITLKWTADTLATGYIIYKKNKESIDWGAPIAALPKTALQYVDVNVTNTKAYEYYVRRTYTSSTQFAHGYIYAGINLNAVEQRGKLLLLIDANYVQALATEIAQLKVDLIADGWYVKIKNISRTSAVTDVKTIILNEYNNAADTGINKLKALYLLGKIPVPYSGDIFPDGHDPEHRGAWPADVYYGAMDETFWTDNTINHDSATDVRNHNEIGDGKFDQSYIYGTNVAIQIGRVDLTNMPQFGMSDTLLTKQYLNKAHAYKTGQMQVVRRGLIDDNFGSMGGEAFASTGWSDFSVMFGDSVFDRDYFTSIKQGNYLFSYGCGAGNYFSAQGIGKTEHFNNDSVNTIFTMLFGSFFGDWDSPDNFLRAPLCSPKTGLASAWSGRPYWHFHHMALGENIGYAAQLTQNNYSDFTNGNHFGYAYNYFPTFVHVALMGDPSLRLHPFKPVLGLNLSTINSNKNVVLKWSKSVDSSVIAYSIYNAHNLYEPFKLVSSVSFLDSSYTDLYPLSGKNIYMIRAIRKEQTPSGSYFNMALGSMDSVIAINTSLNTIQSHNLNLIMYPNPSTGLVKIFVDNQINGNINIECYDFSGRLILHKNTSSNITELDFSSFAKGLYVIKVKNGDKESIKKLILE